MSEYTAKHYTRGRGSNPASRVNLRAPKAKWFVYAFDVNNSTWKKLAGPMTQRRATEWAARLEKLNSTGQTQYTASTTI